MPPSAHAEFRRSMSVSHRTAKSTTAPNGATASVAQWRKPWGIAERFGLSSPVAGGRIDGADELCRPIRGCGVLVCAMFPGLAPLGYGTTAPFGAKNGKSLWRPAVCPMPSQKRARWACAAASRCFVEDSSQGRGVGLPSDATPPPPKNTSASLPSLSPPFLHVP